jgi:CYTH domain-containing protein
MGSEIERKFLVWEDLVERVTQNGDVDCSYIVQGYLVSEKGHQVRVRRKGDNGYLTIKGARKGATRQEFEYEIPLEDATAMLKLCSGLIEKYRYAVLVGGRTWEVDVFGGDNLGLVLAEVELQNEHDRLVLPDWVHAEVTNDKRYYNEYLVKLPYRNW